jgi:hypothetical protein
MQQEPTLAMKKPRIRGQLAQKTGNNALSHRDLVKYVDPV